ncbi:hypothetical protein [Burkholderia pyrrocinia]|uniref:hypothetical protein n=1 Tax=Burkholderia pyrrocinia TaxID=60550 RepID=UPI0035C692E3
MVDLRPRGLTGAVVEHISGQVGISVNRNAVPLTRKSRYDLPPANRASRNLVKFVFGEDEHEEALY